MASQQLLLLLFCLFQSSKPESTLDRACTRPGLVPHPEDCTQFLICAEDNGALYVAETVACPKGYSFSSDKGTCVRSQQCRPLGARKERATTPGGACKGAGTYCEGCDRLVVCASLEGKGLVAVANLSCSEVDADMACSKASCTTTTEPQECDDTGKIGRFRCVMPGFFPDPADCKRYHVCSADMSHYAGECDVQFDAEKGQCTREEPNIAAPTPAQCKPLDNPCSGANIAPAQIPSYPSFYVICVPVATKSRKTPLVYQVAVARCPRDFVLSAKTGLCELSCSGRRGRFPDPEDCRAYIECPAGDKKKCPDSFGFDPTRRLCLPEGLVQSCQRPAEAAVTMATTSSQRPGFECLRRGSFVDESDCKKYFVCWPLAQGGYALKRRECPFWTYFSPRGYCQIGFC